MPAKLPSRARLHELFAYDPTTGFLTWRRREGAGRIVGAFNRRFAGKRAGYAASRDHTQYVVVCLRGRNFYAHRIIYKMLYDEEPDLIDHRDRDGLNNRPSNLRSATHTLNQANKGGRRQRRWLKGTRPSNGRFVAFMTVRRKFIHLGTFDTEEEASAAYYLAAHKLYGDYANRD